MNRIVEGAKNMRKAADKKLYKLFTPQKHHGKTKIYNNDNFKAGDMTIRFGERKEKKIPTIKELMKKEEAKLEKKKAKKKSKKRRREYGEKTRKGKKRFLKKMKKKKKSKKGGRRSRRRRKK